MITTKQRASLRALAHGLTPVVIIGKDGLTENVVSSINDALEARELIKIKLLSTCDIPTREISNKVCEKLGADGIQCIGSVVVVYRKSNKENVEHILI